jgi:(p)ppGpp synthase/HD superfamily hydrolase
MKGEMLSKMLVIAVNAHQGQYDKAGAPYILHPLKVMHYLKTDDEELQCIALGHDLFEDTKVTAAELRAEGISERVIAGMMACTKMPGESYEEYKEKIKSNDDAIDVKLADLRHNSDIRRLKGVTDKDVKRTVKYMQFYTELKDLKSKAK